MNIAHDIEETSKWPNPSQLHERKCWGSLRKESGEMKV